MSELSSLTPFAECPNCHKLLEMESRFCPECREPIPEDYAIASAAMVLVNTAACNSANDVKDATRLGIVITLAVSAYIYLMALGGFGLRHLFFVTPLLSAVQVIGPLIWFVRFGSFKFGDDRYVRARQDMTTSFRVAMAIFVVQAGIFVATR
jgi:hypothetical protein